jgi:hypothetical protein
MPRPSSISKLPKETRTLIGQLRDLGWTIDQILDHLRTLLDRAPSRSALGRHIQGMDKLGEKMRRSREVTEVLVRELGDAPESKAARLNIELMHSAMLDIFLRAADGEEIGEEAKATLAGDPMGMMLIAKAIDHLGRAAKANEEFTAAIEKRSAEKARREAATTAERIGRERGISGETLEAIKAGILGVRPKEPPMIEGKPVA